ncbi:hypothetical protein STEG23_021966 [Scotinomys teguina]
MFRGLPVVIEVMDIITDPGHYTGMDLDMAHGSSVNLDVILSFSGNIATQIYLVPVVAQLLDTKITTGGGLHLSIPVALMATCVQDVNIILEYYTQA